MCCSWRPHALLLRRLIKRHKIQLRQLVPSGMSEATVHSRVKELTKLWLHRLDNNSNINGNNRNLNNNNRVRGMTSIETL
jgi:hypothetical protein